MLASRLQGIDDSHACLLTALLQPAVQAFPTHRGFEYSVVRIADSAVWEWTCQMGETNVETGRNSEQSLAVKAVHAAIDQTINDTRNIQSALASLGIDGVRQLVKDIVAAIKKTLH